MGRKKKSGGPRRALPSYTDEEVLDAMDQHCGEHLLVTQGCTSPCGLKRYCQGSRQMGPHLVANPYRRIGWLPDAEKSPEVIALLEVEEKLAIEYL